MGSSWTEPGSFCHAKRPKQKGLNSKWPSQHAAPILPGNAFEPGLKVWTNAANLRGDADGRETLLAAGLVVYTSLDIGFTLHGWQRCWSESLPESPQPSLTVDIYIYVCIYTCVCVYIYICKYLERLSIGKSSWADNHSCDYIQLTNQLDYNNPPVRILMLLTIRLLWNWGSLILLLYSHYMYIHTYENMSIHLQIYIDIDIDRSIDTSGPTVSEDHLATLRGGGAALPPRPAEARGDAGPRAPRHADLGPSERRGHRRVGMVAFSAGKRGEKMVETW